MKRHTLVLGVLLMAVLCAACGKKQEVLDKPEHESSMVPMDLSPVSEDEDTDVSSEKQIEEHDADARLHLQAQQSPHGGEVDDRDEKRNRDHDVAPETVVAEKGNHVIGYLIHVQTSLAFSRRHNSGGNQFSQHP